MNSRSIFITRAPRKRRTHFRRIPLSTTSPKKLSSETVLQTVSRAFQHETIHPSLQKTIYYLSIFVSYWIKWISRGVVKRNQLCIQRGISDSELVVRKMNPACSYFTLIGRSKGKKHPKKTQSLPELKRTKLEKSKSCSIWLND